MLGHSDLVSVAAAIKQQHDQQQQTEQQQEQQNVTEAVARVDMAVPAAAPVIGGSLPSAAHVILGTCAGAVAFETRFGRGIWERRERW